MCFDVGQWREPALLRKHVPGPFDRRDEVIQKSRRRSMYFPGINVADTERKAIDGGVYLAQANAVTIHKVFEFTEDMGASEGERSRWLLVESTAGAYHGYPITAKKFREWMKQTRECCDERPRD